MSESETHMQKYILKTESQKLLTKTTGFFVKHLKKKQQPTTNLEQTSFAPGRGPLAGCHITLLITNLFFLFQFLWNKQEI